MEGFMRALGQVRISSVAKRFCRKWVLDYLEFLSARGLFAHELSSLSVFLGHMEKMGRARFQMDQARWAVLFFLRECALDPSALPTATTRGSALSEGPPFALRKNEGAIGASDPSGMEALADSEASAWAPVMARLDDEFRLRHHSPGTVKVYRRWARDFARWAGVVPPAGVVAGHARDFLTALAHSGVSASTQNQAFSALRFLYNAILRKEFTGLEDTPRAPGRVRFPDALTRAEAASVLRAMRPPWKLAAQVLYGSGLRLQEALSLRIQDVDFAAGLIRTYNAKGSRSRGVPLPRKLAPMLEEHLRRVREGFEQDLRAGFAGAFLPDGLERKLPRAALEWTWQWVFPAMRLTNSSADGKPRRHHLHETGLQKEIKRAASLAGLAKRVSPHTFRHSFATEMLRMGYDIRTVQDLLGHADVATTMIYTHVLAASSGRVLSPLDV